MNPGKAVARETVVVQRAPAPLQAWFACAVLREVAAGRLPDPLRAQVHANPYACLNVVTAGRVFAGAQALPPAFITGPLSAPVATCVPGELRSLSLVFQPWLLEPLFGVRADRVANQVLDAAGATSPLLGAWCRHAAALACGATTWTAFWTELAACAAPTAPQAPQAPHAPQAPRLAFEVLRSDGVEAAAARVGCSSRQYRRRFERHMGLAPTTWLRVVRWEDALRHLVAGPGHASSVAGSAASAGYADQAHLTRETRSITGAAPAHLRRALRAGTASWSLHPAHDRSVQDIG